MRQTPRTRQRPLLVFAVALLAMATIVPILPRPADAQEGGSPAAIPSTWPIGAEPYANIVHWAGQRASDYGCGLTRDRLAAAMLAIVYYEAGYSTAQPPSPMTLGRWDTLSVRSDNARLYAFSDPSTTFQRAYFHAGIGMWQFDSAGGYPLTAAGAIDTWTAAEEASKIIAQRYCASLATDPVEKVKAGWGPWVACWPLQSTGENRCLTAFDDIFDGNAIRSQRITTYPGVTRYGGMEPRSCKLSNVPVTCYFVDPSRAEGYNYWASPGYGGSATAPITAPFYVISQGGREHRFWLSQDTGYGATITASKPITSDARRSLEWSFSNELCDETTQRGACGTPYGHLDEVVAGPASVTVRGWAIDPNVAGPIFVHVYVQGRFSGEVLAGNPRPDVAAAFPGYGPNHGFEVTINGVTQGARDACVYAINVGMGDGNPIIGCGTVNVPDGPAGFWDVPPGHPFGAEISWVAGEGIAEGYDDGRFRPTGLVTRQALAAFLYRLYAVWGASPPGGGTGTFTDVPPGHPFADEIDWMAQAGIGQGFRDGTFRPEDPVTRQAAAAFLARFYALLGRAPQGAGTFTDVPPGHPFADQIGWMAEAGIAQGFDDGTFRPEDPVTRQAAAAYLQRFFELVGPTL